MADAPILSRADLIRVFTGDLAQQFPPILSPTALARLLGAKVKTIYGWIADGRLDGCFRKRGKYNLILRDKALERLFNGPQWSNDKSK